LNIVPYFINNYYLFFGFYPEQNSSVLFLSPYTPAVKLYKLLGKCKTNAGITVFTGIEAVEDML